MLPILILHGVANTDVAHSNTGVANADSNTGVAYSNTGVANTRGL